MKLLKIIVPRTLQNTEMLTILGLEKLNNFYTYTDIHAKKETVIWLPQSVGVLFVKKNY